MSCLFKQPFKIYNFWYETFEDAIITEQEIVSIRKTWYCRAPTEFRAIVVDRIVPRSVAWLKWIVELQNPVFQFKPFNDDFCSSKSFLVCFQCFCGALKTYDTFFLTTLMSFWHEHAFNYAHRIFLGRINMLWLGRRLFISTMLTMGSKSGLIVIFSHLLKFTRSIRQFCERKTLFIIEKIQCSVSSVH